jgi:HYR domain
MRGNATARRWIAALAAAGTIAGALALVAVVQPSLGATIAATGTLDLRAQLRLVSQLGACPPGTIATACGVRTGEGSVPGLGRVDESYIFVADIGTPPCSSGSGKALAYPVVLTVVGKGEIHFALAAGEECVDQESVRTQAQVFTVTGGTGIYVGASGSGTVERVLGGETAAGRIGRETWAGTLIVPNIDFDVTPPTVRGAVAKTVRAARGAKRARVVYSVTARDAVDGRVRASCRPRSRSWFRLGRTRVTCSATDSSANTRIARFAITVRPRR